MDLLGRSIAQFDSRAWASTGESWMSDATQKSFEIPFTMFTIEQNSARRTLPWYLDGAKYSNLFRKVTSA